MMTLNFIKNPLKKLGLEIINQLTLQIKAKSEEKKRSMWSYNMKFDLKKTSAT